MNSLIIEVTRTGTSNDFVLNPETRYISLCGSKPGVTFSIDCGQNKFFSVINDLRYTDADPSASEEAISFFKELTTKFFTDLKYLALDENDPGSLHIRLVANPLELAQIPFEFALPPSNNQVPMLVNPNKQVTLTREVRQESEARYKWPHMPRVLFAWAAPTSSVPHAEHFDALTEVLQPLARPKKNIPFPEPDMDVFLTELPHASLQSITKTIAEGIAAGRPYTHVNILAHGGQKAGPSGFEFRLILCADGTTDQAEKVDGKKLVKAVIPDKAGGFPTVISLSACDSGNTGNTIMPSGSLVYQLHNAGIPCVFASQFPLTQPGSVKLVKTLYRQLFDACDPRVALYDTRMALKDDPSHDWASLVAYARFPEDIDEQLQDAQLKMLFNSMKTTNAWVDHVFKYREKIPADKKEQALLDLESRLNNSIDDLSLYLKPENNKESKLVNLLLQTEHLGLLASAYKRKAEYLFRLIEFKPDSKDELTGKSRETLHNAMEYYSCGFDANTASHWTAMQYLSLKAVLDGSLADEESDIWTIVKMIALKEERKAQKEEDRVWAWGTLAELYMLKPLTVPQNQFDEERKSALATAKDYMTKMAGADKTYNAAKESTARQFERYITWYPELSPGTYRKEIIEMATEIRNILPSLDELLPTA